MKKGITLLLALIMVLSLAACGGNNATEPDETTKADDFPYPTINNKLTWDAINAIPIKSDDMTIQEMRELCVTFMNFNKSALYTPNEDMPFEGTHSGKMDQMIKGQIYAGLPYIGDGGCGNVYRLMDYIDPDTGVLDMEYIKLCPNLFGSHCSSTTYWAWGRVISSVSHAFTRSINHKNGYLRVGPYTYLDDRDFSNTYNTDMIVAKNGMQTMCESYAQMHLADGLVNFHTSGGHVIMATSEPTVAYLPNGEIDPANSFMTISEQAQAWVEYTNEAGDVAQMKENLNKKMSFLALFEKAYIPFTFAEFLGTQPVEKTECSINISGDTVDPYALFGAEVTSNFGISDIYVSLKNDDGKEVYRLVSRANRAGLKQLRISRDKITCLEWGNYDDLNGSYSVEVSAQLSTGERPVLYSGQVTISAD